MKRNIICVPWASWEQEGGLAGLFSARLDNLSKGKEKPVQNPVFLIA